MRALLQRVSSASVEWNSGKVAAIERGLLVFLGVHRDDTDDDAAWLAGKIPRLRIFPDSAGAMNLPLTSIGGALLVVSQFTLHASMKKGTRPSFNQAGSPEAALRLYEVFKLQLEKESGVPVSSGEFGAYMRVSLVNDGPVTLLLDSQSRE